MRRFLLSTLSLLIVMIFLSIPVISVAQDSDDEEAIEYTQLNTTIGISLLYPSGWTAEPLEDGSSALILYSNDTIAEREADASFESGDISLFMSFIPAEHARLFGFVGDTHAEQLTRILGGMVIVHTDDDGVEQFSASEIEVLEATNAVPEITLARYSLADVADGMLILWNITEDIMVSMVVSTATDELADNEALIMGIVESVIFDEAPIEEAD